MSPAAARASATYTPEADRAPRAPAPSYAGFLAAACASGAVCVIVGRSGNASLATPDGVFPVRLHTAATDARESTTSSDTPTRQEAA